MVDPESPKKSVISAAVNPAVDLHNPLFLHPSDSPNIDLVTENLKGASNYKTWSREFLVALEVKNKVGFINGECTKPADDSPTSYLWRRCNALVKTWITRSLSRDIINSVIYCESVEAIWLDLKERYDKIDGARLFSLHKQISTITQGGNSITEYYSRLRELWDEYESLIPPPSNAVNQEYVIFCNQQKMMTFMMGLNECYSQTRSQILMMNPLPTHSQAFSLVCNEESHRNLGVLNQETTVLAVNKPPSQSEDNDMKCEVCTLPGHTKETCYKVIGYPTNYFRGGRRGGMAGRGRGRSFYAPRGRCNYNNGGRGRIQSNNNYPSNQGWTYNANTAFNQSNHGLPTSNTNNGNNQQGALNSQLVQSAPPLTQYQYNQIMSLIGNQGQNPHETGPSYNTQGPSQTGNFDWTDKGDW